MPTNVRDFTIELRKALALPRDELTKLHRTATLDLANRVIFGTPVDTGRARGGWQASVDSPIEDDIDRLDKGGGKTLAAANSVIATIRPFCVSFVSNNTAYIVPLADGHSDQATAGWVDLAVEEVRHNISHQTGVTS